MSTKRDRANTEAVTCAKCSGPITKYAGVAISEWGQKYAHRAGDCQPIEGTSATTLRITAQDCQGELSFAWSCRKIEQGPCGPETAVPCIAAGTDAGAYADHMREVHGAKGITAPKLIRLRKSTPAATLAKPLVPACKFVRWTHRVYSAWQEGVGQTCTETAMRGQFWANADSPHSIWVLPATDCGIDLRVGRPVKLYVAGNGTVSESSSDAKSARREVSRTASIRKQFAQAS